MSILIAILLCYAAFAAFSFAMPKHWSKLVSSASAPPRSLLRAGALGVLALAYWVLVNAYGAPIGSTVWAGTLSVGALLAVLALTYRPSAAMITAGVAGLGATVQALLATVGQ